MRRRWRAMLVGVIVGAICLVNTSGAENGVTPLPKPFDRREFFAPGASTEDSPRQIPVPPSDEPEKTLVILGGVVFDGTGVEAAPQTVVIRGKHIAALLPPGRRSWPKDATVVHADGLWVMPGLIDLHTHLTYAVRPNETTDLDQFDAADAALRGAERLRYFLESGITTVRDLGSHGRVPFRLQEWVNEGRLPGPRILAAGQLIAGVGGHGADDEAAHTAPREPNAWVREASGPDDWRNAVREQFKRGADLIKIASHFSETEIVAAVDEAHRLGLKVTVDAETQYIDMALAAGVDCIEHPLPRSAGAIATMAAKGVCAVPTLVPYEIMLDRFGGYYGAPSRRFSIGKAQHLAMLRQLATAGVTLGVGTDLVGDWYRYLPAPYIIELKHLIELGYTPSEALVAATRTNAQLLGMGDRLGTLAPGMLADVLLVRGRPDRRIDDLANVRLVLRDGKVVLSEGRILVERHEPEPMPTKPVSSTAG